MSNLDQKYHGEVMKNTYANILASTITEFGLNGSNGEEIWRRNLAERERERGRWRDLT